MPAKLKQRTIQRRSTAFKLRQFDPAERTFVGYASVWGEVEHYPEVMHAGAFQKTLQERGDKVKLLWQHRTDQPIGRIISMEEDEIGLRMRGRISETALGNDALTLLRDGAISELSIGFDVVQSEPDDEGIEHIYEVRLWEVSLVTFPANEGALVLDVRNTGGNRQHMEITLQVDGTAGSLQAFADALTQVAASMADDSADADTAHDNDPPAPVAEPAGEGDESVSETQDPPAVEQAGPEPEQDTTTPTDTGEPGHSTSPTFGGEGDNVLTELHDLQVELMALEIVTGLPEENYNEYIR